VMTMPPALIRMDLLTVPVIVDIPEMV
jgi:hypothetical protein